MSKKIAKLEAIRGLAALYVVFHHCFEKYSIFFKFGQEAVILFFILSGFVIQLAYTKSKDKSFKTYFLKRFLRIYIPLICVFILNFLVYSYQNNTLVHIDSKSLLLNILMLQDKSRFKPNVIVDPFLGNSPLWSLSYEWWFYMIFFVLVTNVKKNLSKLVYGIGIVSAITYLIYPNFINRELMYLVIWWVGVDLATIYLNKEKFNIQAIKVPLVVLTACTAILGINVFILNKFSSAEIGMHPFLEFRHFLFAIIALLIALVWKRFNWIGFKQTIGLFEPVASISFGVYILHWFMIFRATYLNHIISNPLLRYSCYFMICLGTAYVIERIIYVRLNSIIMKLFSTEKKTVKQNILIPVGS
jgi:peptidoglycan/LPS O-acetylase OafA/YrhL